MIKDINDSTKVSELTVGELRALLVAWTETPKANTDLSVRGLKGLSDLLGVGLTRAKEIKASGILDAAIHQQGRTIIIEPRKALDLWAKSCHGRQAL